MSQEEERALGESMFRSSPMSLVQLYIPMEAAQVVTMRAGDLGLIQFRDVRFVVSFLFNALPIS